MAACAASPAPPDPDPAAAVECETFHKLELYMASDKFLDKLKQAPRPEDVAKQIHEAMGSNITTSSAGKSSMATFQVEQPPTRPAAELGSSAVPTADAADAGTGASVAAAGSSDGTSCSGADVLSPEGFVMIDRQAAIEAMAFYIAESLMRCPQAYSMNPQQLQKGVIEAIQGMKQSRFKQLCRAGTYAYRWTALGYSAFQMYSNPWIMQAIVTAIITFSRMTLRPWLI